MPEAYIALGSNLGNRQANLAMALKMLLPLVRVDGVSPLYESQPQPPAPPPSYYNAACRVTTGLRPLLLLRHLKRIEAMIGRRPSPRWSPRPIDLDIALYGNEVLAGEELSLPHPRLAERAFVLRPLLDIDPDLSHPVTGERFAGLLAKLDESALTLVEHSGWEKRQVLTEPVDA